MGVQRTHRSTGGTWEYRGDMGVQGNTKEYRGMHESTGGYKGEQG